MPHRALLIAFLLISAGPAFSVWAEHQTDAAAFFENRVRPVLIDSCVKCHGESKASQGLRVDSREALLRGGDSGPAIVPGAANESLLVQVIRQTHDAIAMPPDKPLSSEVVEDIARWIAEGVVWPEAAAITDAQTHWAFQPLQKVAPPSDVGDWSDHPIDRFLAAAWREQGLEPVRPASAPVLLRRLYFDLIGLPPTPKQTDEFLEAATRDREAAIRNLIDQLLASPQYGERWGRHWMDVVRYADTAGDNADYPIPEARLYRDYIIDSFNADKPYDQFLREQLAGDILAKQSDERYAEQTVATGFLALSRRYATAPYELWHLTLEDTVDTVGRAFLGLTMKCARCHDHKFDPVTTQDYYALYGIFDSTQFPWAGGEEFHSKKFPRQHFVSLLPDEKAKPLLASFEERLATLAEQIETLDEQLKSCDESEKAKIEKEVARLREEDLVLRRSGLPTGVPGAYAVAEGDAHDVAVQIAGDPTQPGETVPRGAIEFLCDAPLDIPADASGRLQLAEWITRPDHPLTARVLVNRVWQQHFGRGIVETPSNFGTSGSLPTHPELIDFLAQEFVSSGWSIKHMHRLILTAQAWQLSSDDKSANSTIDPGNTFYWRHDRRRLDAEAIRDAMLSVSGMLDLGRPGEHPFPPIKEWHWTQHNQFKDCYETPHRSVYLMTQRIQRHPFLALFDGPDTNTTTARRTSSTVTPQSLHLMNSPEMAKIAGHFCERLMNEADGVHERIELAHRLSFARSATPQELRQASDYIDLVSAELDMGQLSVEDRDHEAWRGYARILLSSNEFFYID